MSGTHLMFVRHGETVGNSEQIAHGQTESPLSERGRRQAEATAALLQGWHRRYHRVYASPLSRARDTGRAISEALDLPLHLHDELVEGSLGDWEGVTYAELHELGFAKHSIRDDHFRGHNGESPAQLARRMFAAVTHIRDKHEGEDIIVVSHGAAISHALSLLLGTAPLFGPRYLMHNSAVTEVTFDPEPKIAHLNYIDHLPDELRADPHRRDQNVQ